MKCSWTSWLTGTKLHRLKRIHEIKFLGHIFFTAFAAVAAVCSAPAFGQGTGDVLSQALDLVRQAEKPTGNPPADAQRIDVLTQAIKLAQEAPNHRLKGHRVLAIQAIRSAITEIRAGDPSHQATTYLHTADMELETSISLAQGSEPAPSLQTPPNPQPATSTNGAPAPTDPSWMAYPTINITQAEADIFNAARGGNLARLKPLLAGEPTLAQSHVSCEMTPLLGAAAGPRRCGGGLARCEGGCEREKLD